MNEKTATKVALNDEDHEYLSKLFHKASIDVELAKAPEVETKEEGEENSNQNQYERLYTRFQILLGQSRINDNPTIKTKLQEVIQEMVRLKVIDQETADLTIEEYCS